MQTGTVCGWHSFLLKCRGCTYEPVRLQSFSSDAGRLGVRFYSQNFTEDSGPTIDDGSWRSFLLMVCEAQAMHHMMKSYYSASGLGDGIRKAMAALVPDAQLRRKVYMSSFQPLKRVTSPCAFEFMVAFLEPLISCLEAFGVTPERALKSPEGAAAAIAQLMTMLMLRRLQWYSGNCWTSQLLVEANANLRSFLSDRAESKKQRPVKAGLAGLFANAARALLNSVAAGMASNAVTASPSPYVLVPTPKAALIRLAQGSMVQFLMLSWESERRNHVLYFLECMARLTNTAPVWREFAFATFEHVLVLRRRSSLSAAHTKAHSQLLGMVIHSMGPLLQTNAYIPSSDAMSALMEVLGPAGLLDYLLACLVAGSTRFRLTDDPAMSPNNTVCLSLPGDVQVLVDSNDAGAIYCSRSIVEGFSLEADGSLNLQGVSVTEPAAMAAQRSNLRILLTSGSLIEKARELSKRFPDVATALLAACLQSKAGIPLATVLLMEIAYKKLPLTTQEAALQVGI